MAENPKFPGTDIEVVEKYAPGKRLDFPDFGSVCKTSFAKGVIIDYGEGNTIDEPITGIQMVNSDPLTVVSMVKVRIEGVTKESEYIPIFYHPKKQYWDDMGIKGNLLVDQKDTAVEYSGGSFTKAWMSFRCGDEVVVMLNKEKPVAVLGFADAKPKIGENILKIIMGGSYYFNALRVPRVLYKNKEKGPDGKPLGLTLKCRKLKFPDPEPEVVMLPDGFYQEIKVDAWIESEDSVWDSGLVTVTITTSQLVFKGTVESYLYKIKATLKGKKYAYLVVIGPILFWIDVTISSVEQEPMKFGGPEDFEGRGVFCISHIKATVNHRGPGEPYMGEDMDFTNQMCLDYLAEMVKLSTWDGKSLFSPPKRDHTPKRVPDELFIGDAYPIGIIYAAVYTKKLYAKAVAAVSREKRPKEFKEQIAGMILFRDIPGAILNMPLFQDVPEPIFFVKPHTQGDTI